MKSPWINLHKTTSAAITSYRQSLKQGYPRHVVIDELVNAVQLDSVVKALETPEHWKTQKHTYSALYVDNKQWRQADSQERFVKRDLWQPHAINTAVQDKHRQLAEEFLHFLRSQPFLALLSNIFEVELTDINLHQPKLNTNYFRLNATDFVAEHADDSPGREVCMLLYLNKNWLQHQGGELVFSGQNNQPIYISPSYNRCVLFDPSSEGSEHWVNKVNSVTEGLYRYNVTSWYWSE